MSLCHCDLETTYFTQYVAKSTRYEKERAPAGASSKGTRCHSLTKQFEKVNNNNFNVIENL